MKKPRRSGAFGFSCRTTGTGSGQRKVVSVDGFGHLVVNPDLFHQGGMVVEVLAGGLAACQVFGDQAGGAGFRPG